MSSYDIDGIFLADEIETAKIHHFHYHQNSNQNSLQPSPSHSRSPSFRDDRKLLAAYKTSSLDDIRRGSVTSFQSFHQPKRNSSRRSRRSQLSYDDGRIPSRSSSFGEDKRKSLRRKSNARRKSVALSVEEKAKERRRQRIVCIVIGMFLFLLFASVSAVVITLTHRSEFFYENKTTIYYTFAPHPKVVDSEFFKNTDVRKENQELINSINREHSTTSSSTNSSAAVSKD